MLIPRVDDASYPLESLSIVFVFGSLVQPVECCIDCINGFVGWIVLVSLNRCEEVVCTVRLSVGTNVEIQPRSERVDGRFRKAVS